MAKQRRRRRFWSDEEKRRIVAQTKVPGVSVAQIARRYDVNANQVFNWARDPRFACADEDASAAEPAMFLPVEVTNSRSDWPLFNAQASSSGPAAPGSVEIFLLNGRRLLLSGSFDADAVARLVRKLDG